MRATVILPFVVGLALAVMPSCSRHREKAPDVVPIPGGELSEVEKEKDPEEPVSGSIVAVGPLKEGEEVTCKNACIQVLYCNQRLAGRPPKRVDFVKCFRSCKQLTTDTDKIRTRILLDCVSKHRGNDCKGLKRCMLESLKSAKARLKEMKKERERLKDH